MKYDLMCIGTAIVDSIIRGFDPEPISASGFRAESGSLNVGGEAVNEAMAAAKLGLRTGILCHLGEDAAGDMIASALMSCGVDTVSAVRTAEHPTPVTTMFVKEDGTRKSITNGAHRYNFHPEQYPERFLDARAISLGSLFRAPFDDPGIIRETIRPAHEKGLLVLADTKLPNFKKVTLDDLNEVLPMIDYIFPNEDEARYYTGREEPQEMADVFLSKGIKNVIIKLGAKGCYFRNEKEEICLDACRIHAVDATGAGDNFIAGFAAGLLTGTQGTAPDSSIAAGLGNMTAETFSETAKTPLSHGNILRFANACGAICASAVGAAAGLRSREQVLEFLEGQNQAL